MQKQSDFQGISCSGLGSAHVFLDNSGGDIQNFPSDRNTLQFCAWQIVDTLRRPQMDISHLMVSSMPTKVKQYKADTMMKSQGWMW